MRTAVGGFEKPRLVGSRSRSPLTIAGWVNSGPDATARELAFPAEEVNARLMTAAASRKYKMRETSIEQLGLQKAAAVVTT